MGEYPNQYWKMPLIYFYLHIKEITKMIIKRFIPAAFGLLLTGSVYFGAQQWEKESQLTELNSSETDSKEQGIHGALEYYSSLRMNEATQTLNPEWMQAAVAQADAMSSVTKRLNKKIEWTNMGPDNVGGRIRAFHRNTKKPNIWFAGGVSGGLFRSTSYGNSWAPINDQQENLNVTCIAQTPDGKIYYGTGEGGFTNLAGTRNGSPAFLGGGVFASSNEEGTQFDVVLQAKDSRFQQCNSMVADPNANRIFVGTEVGLYEIDFSGATPVVTRLAGGAIKEIKIDYNSTIWASTSSGAVYKKEANGSLATKNIGFNSGGRTAIAISPDDANYIYTLGSGSGANYGKLVALYRTTDGGENWEVLMEGNTVNDVFGPNSQGWYDNVISVVPGNKDEVIFAGVTMARWDAVNGFREFGSTFGADWNTSYVHADKHLIDWDTTTSPATCVIGSDGGLYRSTNLSTWTPINRGFTTLQLYNVAANELGYVVGGSQDNGTQLINFKGNSVNGQESKTAFSIYGGDGFDAEFSKIDPNIVFMSTYYGTVARSNNCGQSSSTFFDDRQPGTVRTDFNTTFNLWEASETESRLYLAKNSEVWMAKNPTDFANPVEWYLIAKGLGSGRILEMDYTPDGNHLFIAKSGALYRVDGLNDAEFTLDANPVASVIADGITTVQMSNSGFSGRVVTSVNVNPTNPNHVILTLGGYGNTSYVLESTNALDANPTFSNITGNLPSMPVYDAVIDVDDANRIIIGTDLGIWATENGGTTWEEANEGMARVPVFEIRAYEWRPWEGMVMYIGTHGRGYYRSTSLKTSTTKIIKNSLKAKLTPNPVVSSTQINFESKVSGDAIYAIYNMNGKLISQKKFSANRGNNKILVNAANLKSGIYFIKVDLAGQYSSTLKMIKK